MSLNPSPALAALLSFLFPGLGQIYAGKLRRGVIWAIPMLAFLVAVLWLVLGAKGALLAIASDGGKWLGVLVLNFAFFLYHVAAMIDAYAAAKAERFRGFSRTPSTAPVLLAVLIALTMVLHGVPEVVGYDVNNVIAALLPGHDVIPSFTPRPTLAPTITPAVTPTPLATETPGGSVEPTTPPPSGSVGPSPTPKPCPPIDLSSWPAAADGRLNILITGSDSRSEDGSNAAGIRTDSMILLSVDIASCKAALFSFPRNMQTGFSGYPDWLQIPLQDGGNFTGMLNALWNDSASAACQASFDCDQGWRALTSAIQSMTNEQLDGVVAVNLAGFVALVDALPGHGVWIDVPYRLQDLPEPCPPPNQNKTCHYADSHGNPMIVDFQPGCQFLNPEEALAFARSRHQDSDYKRAQRQQMFLQQVRRQLDPLAMLGSLDSLLNAAQQNLYMSFDRSDIQLLAQAASRVDPDRLYRFEFGPGNVTELGSMDGMAAKVQNIFSEPEPLPENPNGPPCPPKN